MKKTIFCLVASIGLFFTACDPVCDEHELSGSISADQLKTFCKVELVQENGVNVNRVRCTTNAPCNVVWSNGVESSTKPTCEFTLFGTGEQVVSCQALCGNGELISAEFPVTVDAMSDNYPVDPTWAILCGDGEKVWTWDDSEGGVWGNCGYMRTPINVWWNDLTAEGIADQMVGYSYPLDDSGDATMTFVLTGTKVIKSSGGQGRFTFKMYDKKDITFAIGKLSVTGDGILFPIRINSGDPGLIVNEYDIIQLDDDKMQLINAPEGTGDGGEATYWKFKAVK
ncbi:hypothetical protein [uncultured Bacteroides sp.]|uniref:hypothetical protein n=1 Tax=uncultured Bacteroides sp. TaxID=162156 RepID=UPI00260792C9|nr:hypothetical protein [uncultured Bacteroides sp.]